MIEHPGARPTARREAGAADRLSELSGCAAGTRGHCAGLRRRSSSTTASFGSWTGRTRPSGSCRQALRRVNVPSCVAATTAATIRPINRSTAEPDAVRCTARGMTFETERHVTRRFCELVPGRGIVVRQSRWPRRDRGAPRGHGRAAFMPETDAVTGAAPSLINHRSSPAADDEPLGPVLAVDRVAEPPHELELAGSLAVGRPPRMRQHPTELVTWVSTGHHSSRRTRPCRAATHALSAVSRIGIQ